MQKVHSTLEITETLIWRENPLQEPDNWEESKHRLQAEIVEAVKYKIFREVCQAKLHWNIFFHFREIPSTGLVNRVKIGIVLCLLRC